MIVELTRTSKITKGSNFIESQVDDELVLMDTISGKFFKLADTGKRAWELLDNTESYGDVIDVLSDEYEVSADRCKSDTDRLIGQLRDKSLISVS